MIVAALIAVAANGLRSFVAVIVIVIGGSAIIGIIRAMVAVPIVSVTGAVIRFLLAEIQTTHGHPRSPPSQRTGRRRHLVTTRRKPALVPPTSEVLRSVA